MRLIEKMFEVGARQTEIEITRTRQDKKVIENFLKNLESRKVQEVSFGFLSHYFIFQFNYWSDKKTEHKKTLSWFIGKKAVERYFTRKKSDKISFAIRANNKVDFSKLNPSNVPALPVLETEYDRQEKLRFFNTKKGFANCLDSTSLYTPTITCIKCNWKEQCKKVLRRNYPKLYRLRNVK